MRPFFVAAAYAYRAAPLHSKKVFASCKHRHRTRLTAQRCADRQPRKIGGRSRWWRVEEIVLVKTVTVSR